MVVVVKRGVRHRHKLSCQSEYSKTNTSFYKKRDQDNTIPLYYYLGITIEWIEVFRLYSTTKENRMKEEKRDLKEIVSRRLEFFRKKPESAIYKPKVSSKHIQGLYTETKVREHLVQSDYGEAAGGTNMAPNPIELLLSALAACIEAACNVSHYSDPKFSQ